MQVDFEVAAFKAIRRCFPNTQNAGSFFSFWARISETGADLELVSLHNQNGHLAELMRLITGVDLGLLEKIEEAWCSVKRVNNFDKENI